MPPQVKSHNRRRLLVYGGLAAAMLLLLLLTRRGSSSAAAAQSAPTAQPVSNPAVDPASYYSGGSGAGGVDYAPQLSSLDTDVQTLAQAVSALQTNAQNPGSSTPGNGGTDTAGLITAITGAITAGASIAGQGKGTTNNSTVNNNYGPGSKKNKTRPPTLPAGWKRAPSGPKKPQHPPKGYTVVGLGSGNWGYKPAKGPGNRKH